MQYNGLCMVSCDCYSTNLAKGNQTLGKSAGFSECHLPEQLIIHRVGKSFLFFKSLITVLNQSILYLHKN